jgi:hypothetical protein
MRIFGTLIGGLLEDGAVYPAKDYFSFPGVYISRNLHILTVPIPHY